MDFLNSPIQTHYWLFVNNNVTVAVYLSMEEWEHKTASKILQKRLKTSMLGTMSGDAIPECGAGAAKVLGVKAHKPLKCISGLYEEVKPFSKYSSSHLLDPIVGWVIAFKYSKKGRYKIEIPWCDIHDPTFLSPFNTADFGAVFAMTNKAANREL